ncbi:hypothetical protein yberc0001_34640 [Yersinia bercovieri ATCC 43970]|uniref:Uncharacterized protein n=1 Tax=Yersinia bercovieri ATCC 43970 TaxID=349968 RepID=A0ABM9Y3E6_YERBE|nr:hypothetical protein yberc0001_34640 [Yersinia bercovieri ATCC 43970]
MLGARLFGRQKPFQNNINVTGNMSRKGNYLDNIGTNRFIAV